LWWEEEIFSSPFSPLRRSQSFLSWMNRSSERRVFFIFFLSPLAAWERKMILPFPLFLLGSFFVPPEVGALLSPSLSLSSFPPLFRFFFSFFVTPIEEAERPVLSFFSISERPCRVMSERWSNPLFPPPDRFFSSPRHTSGERRKPRPSPVVSVGRPLFP